MDIFQTLLITLVIFSVLVAGYLAVTGTGAGKAQKRRLESLRYRHSESTDAKVESQFKKAIAARKPKSHKVAGAGSRTEALEMRLDRTGKGWTVTQYIYATLGIILAVGVVLYIQTGALLLSLGVGGSSALACRILWSAISSASGRTTSTRSSQTASNCWCAVFVLALPVTETLAVVAEGSPRPCWDRIQRHR